jgi:hypothetical protein
MKMLIMPFSACHLKGGQDLKTQVNKKTTNKPLL